eukprot:COSAG02_NODE_9769_length_2115_cov_1.868056_1_plen_251_part_00
MHAAGANHVETMDLLVRYGAEIDKVDEHGWTALMIATWYGSTDAVRWLLKHGSDWRKTAPNRRGGTSHDTALACAIREGRSERTADVLKAWLQEHGTISEIEAVENQLTNRHSLDQQLEEIEPEPQPELQSVSEVKDSLLRQWARDNLDDPSWSQFESTRDALQAHRASNGLERADSNKVPQYRSAPMRTKAAAQLITEFHMEIEELRKQEVEARIQAEQVVTESISVDAEVDAQLTSIEAQMVMLKGKR